LAGCGEARAAELDAATLGGGQGGLGALADGSPLVLGDGGEDVDGEPVGAAVLKFGFGHPAPFCHVPLSQCFRALNASPAASSYYPVPSRPGSSRSGIPLEQGSPSFCR